MIGPDFRKDLPAHYPEMPTANASVKIPIAARYATATEPTITVGVSQGQVIYHYKK